MSAVTTHRLTMSKNHEGEAKRLLWPRGDGKVPVWLALYKFYTSTYLLSIYL